MIDAVSIRYAFAWVYGYVAVYYALVFLHRRNQRQYLFFSFVGAALTIIAMGNARRLAATSAYEAVRAHQLAGIGAILFGASLNAFAHTLAQRRTKFSSLVPWYAAAGILLAVLGVFFDAKPPTTPPMWNAYGLWFARPSIRPLCWVYFLGGLCVLAHAVAMLFLASRRDPDLRGVVFAWSVVVVASFHDVLGTLTGARFYTLVELSGIGGVIAMSYLLLGRFVSVGEALEARTNELLDRYVELQDTQDKLARQLQLAAVGELSAVIAHEIRNPLGILKNAISGLRRRNARPEDTRTLLSIVAEETDKLNRLMQDLFTYANPKKPEALPVDVETLLRSAYELAQRGRFADPAVEVAFDIQLADETRSIEGDEESLRRAVVNVVENALQSMRRVATRKLRLSASDVSAVAGERWVTIQCEDTGLGIGRENLSLPWVPNSDVTLTR